MALKIALDFNVLLDYITDSSNPSISIMFTEIDDYENIYIENVNRLILNIIPAGSINGKIDLAVYNNNVLLEHADETELDRIIEDLADSVYISGNVNSYNSLNSLMLIDAANLDFDGLSSIVLYTQNSANNVLNKSLTIVRIIQGKFNIPIALKTFTLDLQSLPLFTYIRVPSLDNRYYYVNSVQRYTDVLTRYTFGEDVLMSWQSLIKSQSAFVTRQADGNDYLVDNRFPLKNIYTVDHLDGSIIDTPSAQSKVNCVLNFDIEGTSDEQTNFLVSTKLPRDVDTPSSYPMVTQAEDIEAPDNYLPSIKAHTAPQTINYFLNQRSIDALINACMNDDTTASFIDNIMWLPFSPLSVFPYADPTFLTVYVGKKKLDDQFYRFKNLNESSTNSFGFYSYTKDEVEYRIDNFPYLIIKDFTIAPIYENWRDYEPYTVYEIWVPFCQWVKISATDLFDASGNSNRILIYYSLDVSSGQATAYIYNYSMKYIIWSGACQMGVKLDLSLTNLNENIKQKQSSALNTALGMISSAASIAIGVASENPVAVVGGVLSASKTLASSVNTNRMILDRNTTTFGSNDGALFAVNKVALRITHLAGNLIYDAEKTIFYAMNGKPLNKYISLSGLSGYTEIGDIHFNPMNYNITQDEINEIVAILRNGVIM